MSAFNEWLDGVLDGKPCTVESFARSAIGDLPRIETSVRGPSRQDVWPADVWAEMQAIARGERDGEPASGMSAGTAKTAQPVEGEARQPGAEGRRPPSPVHKYDAEQLGENHHG